MEKQITNFVGTLVLLVCGASVHAGVIYTNGFESGTLGSEWSTASSTVNGRISASNVLGGPAKSGSFHLTMDRSRPGNINLNEAILVLDLSGLTGVSLSFWHKDTNDEDTALPSSSFSGSFNGDGVSFSIDGTNWNTLVSLNNANSPNNTYTNFVFDLDAAASAAGVTLGSNTQIKFQQYDNFPFNTDGRTFDDIVVTAAIPEPATLVLMGLGLAGIGFRRRQLKKV